MYKNNGNCKTNILKNYLTENFQIIQEERTKQETTQENKFIATIPQENNNIIIPQFAVQEETTLVKRARAESEYSLLRPPKIDGNLIFWIDGNDPFGDNTTTDLGALIEKWFDKSGKQRHGVSDQAEAKLVKYDNNDKLTVLRFEKDLNYLVKYPSFPNKSFTIFTVQKASQKADFAKVFHAPAQTDNGIYVGIRGENVATFTGIETLWNDIEPNLYEEKPISNLNTWRLVTTRVEGESLEPYTDGLPMDNKIGETKPFDDFYIGFFDTQSWIGDIAEVIIYDKALSWGDRIKVEQYLSKKWNLKYNFIEKPPERISIEVLREIQKEKQEAALAEAEEATEATEEAASEDESGLPIKKTRKVKTKSKILARGIKVPAEEKAITETKTINEIKAITEVTPEIGEKKKEKKKRSKKRSKRRSKRRSKKSRKGSRKSRKGSKKSRKGSKKSRKGSKKSRKGSTKSRKGSKKSKKTSKRTKNLKKKIEIENLTNTIYSQLLEGFYSI